MLERWVCEGVVDDPGGEFMVQEDASIATDALSAEGGSAFWADRFTLRAAADLDTGAPPPGGAARDVPSFLAPAQAAILDAGKCLNLARSCGRTPPRPLPAGRHLEYDESGRFLLAVEEAHRAAAAAAMTLLRSDVGLVPSMRALKRYFLGSQGDMFLAFMDSAAAELNTESGQVPLAKLQGLLDLSARASSAAGDPAVGRLRAAYDHRSVLSMLIAVTQTAAAPAAGQSPTKRARVSRRWGGALGNPRALNHNPKP
jgi:gamma-tubulin complex component 2